MLHQVGAGLLHFSPFIGLWLLGVLCAYPAISIAFILTLSAGKSINAVLTAYTQVLRPNDIACPARLCSHKAAAAGTHTQRHP